PGLVNQRLPAAATPTPNETLTSAMGEAERGMIKGKVHIMADERTNKLIVTTKPENMTFFDDIIKELDVATDPPVKVDVRRLEYADAEEVATKLNELIGGTAPRQGTGTTPATATGRPGATTPGAPADSAGGGRLADVTARIEAARNAAAAAAAAADGSASSLAQLSKDNIKILSDKRTNAIIMMGSRGDLAAIQDVITKMDIRLAQVLIEVVVIQVELSNGITAGMDWVLGKAANDYTMRNDKDKGAGGGGTGMSLLGSLTGIASGASGTNEVLSAASHVLNRGINYFLHSDKLNISALIQAAKTDSHAKVLSSPVILTVDNKDASIEVTTMRYLYKGMRVSGGGGYSAYYELPDFEQKDIGLILKVTPRINPNGTVVLTVDQDFSTVGPDQDVGGDKYPTINKRLLKADVSVENMQTAVLGGLVGSESIKSEDGIPILKDIPWIGRWLFGSVKDTEIRSELLVFLTPYVFEDSASLLAEAERRKLTLSDPRPWSDKGWSSGPLADPMSAKEIQDREIRKWAAEDAEYKAKREQEKLYEERAKMLQKRAEKEAAEAAKRQKKGLPPAPTWPTVRAGGDDVDVYWQEDEDDSL
ncbi:MAG: hypothetical protein FWH21_10065, partial [Kiritimatiellaeota bacterium]|nr:hypothetical protein [Kiritimatiellota bacterium]